MERDLAYLLDIVLAARKAPRFVADLSWEEFAESELHQIGGLSAIYRRFVGARVNGWPVNESYSHL